MNPGVGGLMIFFGVAPAPTKKGGPGQAPAPRKGGEIKRRGGGQGGRGVSPLFDIEDSFKITLKISSLLLQQGRQFDHRSGAFDTL